MQLEPLKALSHTHWWLISFVCVCVCVCVCVHVCVGSLFSLRSCFPSTFPPKLTTATNYCIFVLSELPWLHICDQTLNRNAKKPRVMTHMHTHSPARHDSVCTHPSITTSVPTAVCVCVCVCVCVRVCVCVLCCVVCLVSLAPGEQNKATWDWRTSECYVYSSSSLHQRGRRLHASMQWGFYPSCSCVHIDKLLPSAVLLHVYFISTGFLHLTSALKSHAWRKHCGHTTDGK